jgi:hypothetical protein
MNSIFLPSPSGVVSRAHAVSPTIAVPTDQWPIWATAISFFKSGSDIGVGDTAERIIGATNSEEFQLWYKKTFGKSCGCSYRKVLWNTKFPYEQH